MVQRLSESDIGELSVPERLDLIALLWDSLPDSTQTLPVPEWHWQELEHRLAAANAHPESAIPWEQAKARLREKP